MISATSSLRGGRRPTKQSSAAMALFEASRAALDDGSKVWIASSRYALLAMTPS